MADVTDFTTHMPKCPNCDTPVSYVTLANDVLAPKDVCPVRVGEKNLDPEYFVTYFAEPCTCRVHSFWWKQCTVSKAYYDHMGIFIPSRPITQNQKTELKKLGNLLTKLYSLEAAASDPAVQANAKSWALYTVAAMQALVPGVHNLNAGMTIQKLPAVLNDNVTANCGAARKAITSTTNDEADAMAAALIALQGEKQITDVVAYTLEQITTVLKQTLNGLLDLDAVFDKARNRFLPTHRNTFRYDVLWDLERYVKATEKTRESFGLQPGTMAYIEEFLKANPPKPKSDEIDPTTVRRRRTIRHLDIS